MDLRRLRRAIGGSARRGGEPVLRRDEHDRAAELLPFHQAERFARDEEIAGREDVHVLLPHRQLRRLERRRGRDAGIRDENVEAAIFGRGLGEGAGDRRLVRYIENARRERNPCRAMCEIPPASHRAMPRRCRQARRQAPSPEQPVAVARPMPPAPPVTSAILAGEALRLRHALKLRLFEQPVFDVEGFLLLQPEIVGDSRRAAHDVDRVDVELGRRSAPSPCPWRR